MNSLLSLTLITGVTDSFNPFGIAQQFTLQGLLKKKHDILYYIAAMFVTNFCTGLLLYWGMASFIDRVLDRYWSVLQRPLAIVALLVGIGLAYKSIQSILISWRQRKLLASRSQEESQELEKKFAEKTMTKSYLFGIGFLTTLMEATTAAPYIAYLALVQSYQLSLVSFMLILTLYNILYSLPLIVLYILPFFFKDAFQSIYKRLDVAIQILSAFLVPTLLLVISIILFVFFYNYF